MEILWEHTFQTELAASPNKHPILMTEPPMNPKANREKMTQVMFEKFNTPGLYVANTAALSLLSVGIKTGFAVVVGEGSSYAVPVYEGCTLPHTVPKLECSGSDLTFHMMSLLTKGDRHSLSHGDSPRASKDIIENENLCYVAQDFEKELLKPAYAMDVNYTDPVTDALITIGNERFRCPEALFRPSEWGCGHIGLHEAVYYSVKRCDVDIQDELYNNIVLSGGSSLFPGLQERLQSEVAALVPGTQVKVIAEENRKQAVWIGGSKMASSPDFRQKMMTRDEYEEFGPALVHLKCF